MKTEVVVPLCSTLADQHWEGLVRGWRDVAHGLEFLHYKVNQMVQLWYCSWSTGGGSGDDGGGDGGGGGGDGGGDGRGGGGGGADIGILVVVVLVIVGYW